MLIVALRVLLMQICLVGSVYGAASSPEQVIIARACMNSEACADISNVEAVRELLHAVSGNPCYEYVHYICAQPHDILNMVHTITQQSLEDNPVLVPVMIANQAGVSYQMDQLFWQRDLKKKFPELVTPAGIPLCIPHYLPFGWLLQAQQNYKGEGFVQEIDIPLVYRAVKLKLKTEPNGGLPFIAHAAYAVANYLTVRDGIKGVEYCNCYNSVEALLLAEKVPAFRGRDPLKIQKDQGDFAKALKERAQELIYQHYGVMLNLPEFRFLPDDNEKNIALLTQFCSKK